MTEEAVRKARTDAWWSALGEEECWEVWGKARRLPWQEVAKWLREAKGLEVSRSAIFRFEKWIRPQQNMRRLELAALARTEAEGLAKAAGTSQDVARAFMTLGAEVGIRTEDPEAASAWIKMAASLLDAARKDAELKLRAEAQKTAAGQLALAREKFEAAERREAAIAEAADAARGGKIDPAALADEIDKILGRRKA